MKLDTRLIRFDKFMYIYVYLLLCQWFAEYFDIINLYYVFPLFSDLFMVDLIFYFHYCDKKSSKIRACISMVMYLML
jgi:hypothetical protein